jgi:glutamyl/glutaminyl-tRNA synthetase
MREERTAGIASKNRDLTIEENMKIWTEMISANPSEEIKKYCVRGKIDFQNTNKCLRDPVFYRFNDIPHHRLGDKYKIYPTYDFACPVVDSHEGVTHCLRTNEYSARIPMYKWVIEALGIRDVTVYEFSRLCLIHTVLSKRNLRWFVNNGMVDGWYDPRFPTVQGILRRGIIVKTLKDFMLAQGPSKNTNLMEWDKVNYNNSSYGLSIETISMLSLRDFLLSLLKMVLNSLSKINLMNPKRSKLTGILRISPSVLELNSEPTSSSSNMTMLRKSLKDKSLLSTNGEIHLLQR